MTTVTLSISGMTCGGCTASVTRILTSTAGVAHATVTLNPGQAVVQFEPSKTSPEVLLSAITKAGFTARVVA